MFKKTLAYLTILAVVLCTPMLCLNNLSTAEGGVAVTPTTIRIGLLRDVPEVHFSVQGKYMLKNGYNGQVIAMAEPGQAYVVEPADRGNSISLRAGGMQLGSFKGPIVLQRVTEEISITSGSGALVKRTGAHSLSAVDATGAVTSLSDNLSAYAVLSAQGTGKLVANDELHLVTLYHGGSSKRYRGDFDFRMGDAGITAINDVPFEEYLYSVVPSEMPATWPEEALKAQAVVARTYALYSRGQYISYGFDLLATQQSQVYHGYDYEHPSTTRAVQQTQGQVLTHRDSLIMSVFHSSSGGYIGNCGEIWLQNVPYLKAKPDPYDYNDIHYKWSVTVSAQQLANQLTSRDCEFSAVYDIQEVKRDESKSRVTSLRLVGLDAKGNPKEIVISNADRVRTVLGLKSSLFTMDKQYDSDNKLSAVTFEGNGWGHGLGMSQYGALGMANKGYNYQDILQYYYTDVKLDYNYGV
ncbi:SpoIID/LytB domain-containing protein [Desulfofalx alkaliphila]|uniref:SpoIID/LytB domain-containing protein n=1 Tax=Desulfofalx alkaliphila TaxID=105483 RepID=UPI00068F6747|nr:SpoIID/LytB domain-containing protein [Desulfofalx alkaliphila]